jgi:hypothetical protein
VFLQIKPKYASAFFLLTSLTLAGVVRLSYAVDPPTPSSQSDSDWKSQISLEPAIQRRITREKYEAYKRHLKATKVGLDPVIDRLVNQVYRIVEEPGSTKLPLFLHLPGAQGTGKTTMIRDFVKELGLSEQFTEILYTDAKAEKFPIDRVIQSLKENSKLSPEQRKPIILLLDETQHVTQWTGTKPALWSILGTGQYTETPATTKEAHIQAMSGYENAIIQQHGIIKSHEDQIAEIKVEQKKAKDAHDGESSFEYSSANDGFKEKIKSAEYQITKAQNTISGYQTNMENFITNIAGDYGDASVQVPGVGSGVKPIAQALMNDPANWAKYKEYLYSSAVPNQLTIDASNLIIVNAFNPKTLDKLQEEFLKLPPEDRTHDSLNALAKKMAPADSINADIQRQFGTDQAWTRRLQLGQDDPIYPYPSSKFKESTRRYLQHRYELSILKFLKDSKVPPRAFPKLIVPDNVIENIYSRIKADPISGVQTYNSSLAATIDSFFDKISFAYENEFVDSHHNSGAKDVWIPKNFEISMEGVGDDALFVAKADTPISEGRQFTIHAPAVFKTEITVQTPKIISPVNYAERRQAYELAGNLVSGLSNFKAMPAGTDFPITLNSTSIASGALYERSVADPYGKKVGFARMLLGGPIAETEFTPAGDPTAARRKNMLEAADIFASIDQGVNYNDNLMDPVTQKTSIADQKAEIARLARVKEEDAAREKRMEEARKKRLQDLEEEAKLREKLGLSTSSGKGSSESSRSYGGSSLFDSDEKGWSSSSNYHSTYSRDREGSDSKNQPEQPAPVTPVADKNQEIAVEEVAKLVNDQELKKRLPDERTRERFAKAYLETLRDIQRHKDLVKAMAQQLETHKVISSEDIVAFMLSHGSAFTAEDRAKIMGSTPGTMAECEILALQETLGLPLGHGDLPGHEKVIIKNENDSGTSRKRNKSSQSGSDNDDAEKGPIANVLNKAFDFLTAPAPKTGETP